MPRQPDPPDDPDLPPFPPLKPVAAKPCTRHGNGPGWGGEAMGAHADTPMPPPREVTPELQALRGKRRGEPMVRHQIAQKRAAVEQLEGRIYDIAMDDDVPVQTSFAAAIALVNRIDPPTTKTSIDMGVRALSDDDLDARIAALAAETGIAGLIGGKGEPE